MLRGAEANCEGGRLTVSGPKGESGMAVPEGFTYRRSEDRLWVTQAPNAAMWGTLRALIDNMVTGVTEGFRYTVELKGVGYKASVKDKALMLSLGYSHAIDVAIPSGVSVEVKGTLLTIGGVCKQTLGQFCARLQRYRAPEPYKGKGVHLHHKPYRESKEGKKK